MARKPGEGARADDKARKVAAKHRLQDVVFREIEAAVDDLLKRPEVDLELLGFLLNHLLRYIATLKVQRKFDPQDVAVQQAQACMERVLALRQSRGADIPPVDDEAIIRRFLEAEDSEMLAMERDSLSSEVGALQEENERLRAERDAGGTHAVLAKESEIAIKEIQARLEQRDAELARLRELSKSSERVRKREAAQASAAAQAAEVEELRHDLARRVELLEKYKSQMKEFGARYRALDSSYKALEQEKLRLSAEVGEWRKKTAERQSTLEKRIQDRGQEMFRLEFMKQAERSSRRKAKEIVDESFDGNAKG